MRSKKKKIRRVQRRAPSLCNSTTRSIKCGGDLQKKRMSNGITILFFLKERQGEGKPSRINKSYLNLIVITKCLVKFGRAKVFLINGTFLYQIRQNDREGKGKHHRFKLKWRWRETKNKSHENDEFFLSWNGRVEKTKKLRAADVTVLLLLNLFPREGSVIVFLPQKSDRKSD